MPLFTHRFTTATSSSASPSSPSYNSKPSKTHKPNSSFSSPYVLSRIHVAVIVFSVVSVLIGIAGTIFAITSGGGGSGSVYRCGGSKDTSSSSSSSRVSGSRKMGGDGGGVLGERRKLLGFVGIQTSFDSGEIRAALRNSWFPSDPKALLSLEQATGLAFRFVIGRSKDAKKMATLDEEIKKYRDFMLLDVEEENIRLPYKTLVFFKEAYNLFEADYYVKADDDIYMRPDRLGTLLAKERHHSRTYIGCMKKGPVITDPKLKWYEKQGNLIGNEYFLHAYGPIYVLSAEIVASLAAARNGSLRMFNNEDVSIGSWMLSMDVHHEDNRALCDPRCSPKSIAVWDIPKCSGLCHPENRLKELHKIEMCSKSPTLPPDDIDK
ncbi:unnamed protein product [Cochlearia groenlandica]